MVSRKLGFEWAWLFLEGRVMGRLRPGMPVRKPHALCGEPVKVRCGDFAALRVVTLYIPVAEVVDVDDEEVGFRCVDGCEMDNDEGK